MPMIAAFDVGYPDDGSAQAAAVVFEHFSDAKPLCSYRKKIAHVEEYMPGSFYKRELPCILELLSEIDENIDIFIVDGYVSLGDRPGLGEHLGKSLNSETAIVGVAKKYFAGSNPVEVHRGRSKNPLFITAWGIALEEARESIASMHGSYRMPTLLKEVDRLSKTRGSEPEKTDARKICR